MEPVFVTDRGRPTHVLMSVETYRRLAGRDRDHRRPIGHARPAPPSTLRRRDSPRPGTGVRTGARPDAPAGHRHRLRAAATPRPAEPTRRQRPGQPRRRGPACSSSALTFAGAGDRRRPRRAPIQGLERQE
ncbi:type II toxin-antitoxin system prevent-host-death family antitoxin [Caulobacter segnis]